MSRHHAFAGRLVPPGRFSQNCFGQTKFREKENLNRGKRRVDTPGYAGIEQEKRKKVPTPQTPPRRERG